jgi:hypothetical protein
MLTYENKGWLFGIFEDNLRGGITARKICGTQLTSRKELAGPYLTS